MLRIFDKKLLTFTSKGIYCEKGGFYIDPYIGVDYAIITHAHSDHAMWGSKYYLANKLSIPILKHRLGQHISALGIEYNQTVNIKGVKVTLYPSGHIIGGAQIKVEYKGEVWVVSGDYKLVNDGISGEFESVECNSFITESTFALPIFVWENQLDIFKQIEDWWKQNQQKGLSSILICYALGKAQRILKNLDLSIGPIYAHGTIENTNEVIRGMGFNIPEIHKYTSNDSKENLKKALVLATSSVMGTSWLKKFYPFSIAQTSGWMQLRGIKKRSTLDRGFILSDHADWVGLNKAIKLSKAEEVYVTHGYSSIYSKYLNEIGINASEIPSRYENINVENE